MRLPSVTQQAVPLHSDPNHPCSPSPVVAQLSVFRRVAPVGLKASPICGRVANCKGHLWFACAPDWRFASDPADFPSPGTPCPGLGFTRSALLFLATPLQLGESGGGTLTRWSAALRGAPQNGPRPLTPGERGPSFHYGRRAFRPGAQAPGGLQSFNPPAASPRPRPLPGRPSGLGGQPPGLPAR